MLPDLLPDTYEWLESPHSESTRDWLHCEKARLQTYIARLEPLAQMIRHRVSALLAATTIDGIAESDTVTLLQRRRPYTTQGIYSLAADRQERLLVSAPSDEQVYELLALSPRGTEVAVGLRRAGEERAMLKVLDVRTGRILWTEDEVGLIRAAVFDPTSDALLYVHEKWPDVIWARCATGQRKKYLEFPHVAERIAVRGLGPGTVLALFAENQACSNHDVYIIDARRPAGLTCVARDLGCLVYPIGVRGDLYAVTDWNAPNRKVVRLHPGAGTDAWQDVVPEMPHLLQQACIRGDTLALSYASPTGSNLVVRSLHLSSSRTLVAEEGWWIRLIDSGPCSRRVYYEMSSLLYGERVMRYDSATDAAVSVLEQSPPLGNIEERRIEISSPDGLRLPVTMLRDRSVASSGVCRPTVLTGYGAFNQVRGMRASIVGRMLLEAGVTVATTAVRGDGELGGRWHCESKRAGKLNAINDFLLVAEWLVREGAANPAALGVMGASAGGLLTCIAITKRPDLFRAALAISPVTDLLNYERMGGPRSWHEEFGDPSEPRQRCVLASYSPLHNLTVGEHYPAVLVVAGARDERANAAHARKFVAALRTAAASTRSILLDHDPLRGHGTPMPIALRAASLVRRLTFLQSELGVPASPTWCH